MNSNTEQPDLSGVMRRLRKIMALAKSSNPGEAGAALHQAQVLMAKHNLTAESVAQIEITESSVKTTGKDLPKWESHLAVVVSDALGVELLVESQQRQQGLRRQNACIVFVGKGCAPEIAVYAYTVLKKQMLADLRRLINQAASNLDIKGIKVTATAAQRSAYALGWCRAAYGKIQAIKPTKDPMVSEYVVQRSQGKSASVKASRKLPPSQDAAFSALGYQHGQNAKLNTAMNGGQQTALLES
jgi:hypothetical protein